jgi:hypothetical protein
MDMAADKDKLDQIKKNIGTSYIYFRENFERYHAYRRYVFKESVTDQQKSMLQQLGRPLVEFNILDAYISRLLGEFVMQEPSIQITPADGIPVELPVLDMVEGHLRHIIYEADKNQFSYEVYKDLLAGGFSVAKVWTDYATKMSFDQQINVSRVFDPTLCGFDPLARAPHKGDGQYSFETFPVTEEDFKRLFPGIEMPNIPMSSGIEGFNWSYKDMQNNKIYLIAEYFEKITKRTKIVKLANGRVMTAKNYKKLEMLWDQEQVFEQIPKIVGKPRWTNLETICMYRLIENQILEYKETDYSYLPHVFIDGHSINLTQGSNQANTTYQMTRPYVYHAKGIQDMTNFAGQTVCNSMENLIQHKFIVMKEAIPQEQDYLEALNDIQRANTIVVNAYSENNPDKPIPTPIREVQNIPLPPEVMNAFQVTGPMTQTILGSFASNLGKNDNDLSGKAVIESASVGNAAAMPYVVGYLAGLTHIGCICVDLMPKYLVGKRKIPVVDKAGNKEYKGINGKEEDGTLQPKMNYDEQAINCYIEAGVNFQVQKSQALQQITALMQASPEFAAFMNDDETLPILVDNLTVYGSDRLKEAVPKWIQKKAQMQQQAQQQQQQAMMMDPRILKVKQEQEKTQMQAQEAQMKMQLDAQQMQIDEQQQQFDNQIQIAKLANEKILVDSKVLEAEAKISQEQINSAVRLEEGQTNLEKHALDAAAKLAEIHSREHNDHLSGHKLAHEISMAHKQLETKDETKD